jgi:hypothetical protein
VVHILPLPYKSGQKSNLNLNYIVAFRIENHAYDVPVYDCDAAATLMIELGSVCWCCDGWRARVFNRAIEGDGELNEALLDWGFCEHP